VKGKMKKVRLLLLSFLLPLAVLSAQEDENENEGEVENERSVRVLVRHSQVPPVVGTTWTLTLFIDHGEPKEVDVIAPPFEEDTIFFDHMLKSLRLVASGELPGEDIALSGPTAHGPRPTVPPTYERWTATEFNFTLNSTGTVSFDSFTVITPRGEVQTEPFEINITRPQETVEKANYRFSWQGVPRELKIGESAVISLSFTGLNRATPAPSIPLPEYGQFIPTLPLGHILEFIPISTEERRTGLALRIRIIAVTAVPFILDRRTMTHGNTTFEIPSLRIPVSRPAVALADANETDHIHSPLPTPHSPLPLPPFPSTGNAAFVNNRLYTRYSTECENIFNTAKNHWERGNLADALAVLRRNEREHDAGRLIAVIRREAERVLGFTGTNDEKKNNPLFFWRTNPLPAVVKETTVRRIPDSDGAEITRFREGQPVLVYSDTDGRRVPWLRVITNDSTGISGWVSEENIIFY
jgi:hypothetical protein